MTLTEFLLARIAEDEAAARKDEPWLWADDENRPIPDAELALVSGADLRMEVPVSRWLAECEAKRRIVARHGGEHFCTIDPLEDEAWWDCFEGDCPTMLTLASVYADHPDYRQEWRP